MLAESRKPRYLQSLGRESIGDLNVTVFFYFFYLIYLFTYFCEAGHTARAAHGLCTCSIAELHPSPKNIIFHFSEFSRLLNECVFLFIGGRGGAGGNILKNDCR